MGHNNVQIELTHPQTHTRALGPGQGARGPGAWVRAEGQLRGPMLKYGGGDQPP